LESVLASHATDERPEIGLHRRRNQVTTLFRGEDAMDQFGNVGVRHGDLQNDFQPPLQDGVLPSFSLPGVETPGYSKASCGRAPFPKRVQRNGRAVPLKLKLAQRRTCRRLL